MKNKVIAGTSLDRINSDLLDHIKSFVESIDSKSYSLVAEGGLYSLGWLDSFRLFLEQYKDNDSPQKKMIVSSLHNLNKTCPWAIPLYFEEFFSCNKGFGVPKRISSLELFNGMNRVNDEFITANSSTLYDAILQSGSSGSLTLKHHDDASPFVETHLGFKTLVSLNEFFHGYVGSREIKDCKVLVVNGAIIDVSEIHHILEYAYDTKDNIIIVSSAFSDDVSNTLYVNWSSGKTHIIPFVLPDSIETINEAKDICTALGIVPVDKANGLRLSNIDLKEHKGIDVYYDSSKDTLRLLLDDVGSLRIHKAKMSLQDQYENEEVDDVKSILSERISRMSARNTVIYTRLSNTSKGLLEDRAGAVFSYFSRCAKQNVVEMNDEYFVKYLPANDAAKAVNMAKSDRRSLSSIKAILRIDDEAC